MHALLLAVTILPAACAQPRRPISPPATCAEPKTISSVPNEKLREILASDPEANPQWRRGTDDHLAINDGLRSYSMSLEGAITATEKGKLLWKTAEVQVAGGGFDLMLSPRGRVVVRLFSRGGLELFDANDGHLLRNVGAATPSPDDRFVLELPRIPFGLDAWDHDDVRFVPLDPKEPVRTIVRLPLKQGDDSEFGATVCGTGGLIAVSFATTELSVYRASDLRKLATVPSPGPGAPVFTRSGRYLVLRENEKPRAMFELVR